MRQKMIFEFLTFCLKVLLHQGLIQSHFLVQLKIFRFFGLFSFENAFERHYFCSYFSSHDKASKSRCEDECEEVYSTLFTYGTCVSNIFARMEPEQRPDCDLRFTFTTFLIFFSRIYSDLRFHVR